MGRSCAFSRAFHDAHTSRRCFFQHPLPATQQYCRHAQDLGVPFAGTGNDGRWNWCRGHLLSNSKPGSIFGAASRGSRTARFSSSSSSNGSTSKKKNIIRSTTNESATIQFNHAGASPSPPNVLRRLHEHLDLEESLGGYAAADAVHAELSQVYTDIAALIHAEDEHEIALTESATVAWTRAFYAMAEMKRNELEKASSTSSPLSLPKQKPTILISDAEYAANVVAVCDYATRNDWNVLSIPSSKVAASASASSSSSALFGASNDSIGEGATTSTGIVDVNVLEAMLEGSYVYRVDEKRKELLDPSCIAMVCITHIPTNSGIVNPVDKIGTAIANFNAQQGGATPAILYLVDACQSVGHLDVDVQEIGCHALMATGRKYLRGPRGTGFLYMRNDIANTILPNHVDHFGVPIAHVPTSYRDGVLVQDAISVIPLRGARRFEFWESNIASRLGLGEVVRYALRKGIDNIERDITTLSSEMRTKLSQIPNGAVIIHHPNTTTCGIVTFHVSGIASSILKYELSQSGYVTSTVPATSTPLDSANAGVPDLLRASISYTTTTREIDAFVRSLSDIIDCHFHPHDDDDDGGGASRS